MDGRKEILSFLRGGFYSSSTGNLYNNKNEGNYWEPKINLDINAWRLTFNLELLDPQSTYTKGFGFSIRCVVKP